MTPLSHPLRARITRTAAATGLALLGLAGASQAADFALTSTDIAEGTPMGPQQVFAGFGCEGGDLSPQLSWVNPPEGTKSFAITAYDPDAPTGSGWWHWTALNLPATTTELDSGASGTLPEGAVELINDYGVAGFGGACPPPGEMHRYIFTVYALGVEALDLPATASNALAGFMIKANAIGEAQITASYTR